MTAIDMTATTATGDEARRLELVKATRDAATTEAEVVAQLNEHYAVVLLGNGPAILREGMASDGRREFRLLTVSGFKEWHRTERVRVGTKQLSTAEVWLNAAERRQYEGLTFSPGRETPTFYNLWRGWPIDPDPNASCERLLDHIYENVCQGDVALFTWVMGWFADLIQNPGRKPGTSLVLRGAQGVGKTIIGRLVGELLALYYLLVADPRYITGRFNSHIVGLLLLQADEGFWAGDHTAEGSLKNLITGDFQVVEYKGKEPVRVENHLRLLITSNAQWVVPAALEERRFAVLDVGDARRQDHRYFAAIEEEMRSGGYGALMHFLLTYNLADVEVRRIPATGALLEQKVRSLPSDAQWWLDVLFRGQLPGPRAGEGMCPTAALHDAYVEAAKKTGVTRRSTEVQLGQFLKDYVPGARGVVGAKSDRRTLQPGAPREQVYLFPPLAYCREAFATKIGQPIDWPDPDDEWGGSRR